MCVCVCVEAVLSRAPEKVLRFCIIEGWDGAKRSTDFHATLLWEDRKIPRCTEKLAMHVGT